MKVRKIKKKYIKMKKKFFVLWNALDVMFDEV